MFGPIIIIIFAATVAGLIQKKIRDAKTIQRLVEKALTAEDIEDLQVLESRGITLSDTQKLTTLLNAYKRSNQGVITKLTAQSFRLNLTTIYNCFREDYDLGLLAILRDGFLDKNARPDPQIINALLRTLATKNAFDQIEALFSLYPEQILGEIFTLIDEKDASSAEFLVFLTTKKEWLIANRKITNDALQEQTNETLINFLMDIFPDANLKLDNSLIHLINGPSRNVSLENRILKYMQKMDKTEDFYQNLEKVISRVLYRKRLDVAEKIFQENPSLLPTRKAFASGLLYVYSRSAKASELLLKFGADSNAKYSEDLSVLEKGISTTYTPVKKKQRMLDIYRRHGVDLNQRLVDAPKKRCDMTLLGYLPFLNLKVDNNQDFDAIKLQKFLALFLEIPGVSHSNGTLCHHTYMQDSQAYWNFLLDLYFKRLVPQGLMANFSAEFSDDYDRCLKAIYSEEGQYDPDLLYQDYSAGKPIILPVYLTDRFGANHIAVVGLMKTGLYSQLVVQADRGLGRHDFSIFSQPCFDYNSFCKYARTRDAPMLTYTWQSHPVKERLRVDLNKQQDDFCSAISAKFALQIAFFLCLTRQDLDKNEQSNSNAPIEDELIRNNYATSASWYENFCRMAQSTLLSDYRSLQTKYIDQEFLQKVETAIKDNPPSEFTPTELGDLADRSDQPQICTL
ncbi:hypothetical protein [Legionella massiliensis]|nr:hypothetical protein [Legionella massiliensis]